MDGYGYNAGAGYGQGGYGGGGYGGGGYGGSFGSGGGRGNVRPGDWNCGACNAHNYANRDACFKCGKPKGEGDMVLSGDRGGGAGDYGGSFGGFGGGGGGRRQMKPGDWICSCYAHNYASRETCYKCGKMKAEAPPELQQQGGGGGYGGQAYGGYGGGQSYGGYGQKYGQGQSYGGSFGGGRSGGGGGGGGREMRPGDWMCTACNAHNFASRDSCFKCQKPKDAEVMA